MKIASNDVTKLYLGQVQVNRVYLGSQMVYDMAPAPVGFNPASLFAGNAGWFYDAGILSSMFQDAAETVPVTAAGQPVRVQRDLSGNGLHRRAPSDAARPILQIDANGRYYLETNGTSHCMSTAAHVWGAAQHTIVTGMGRVSTTGSPVILERGPDNSTNQGSFALTHRVLSSKQTFQMIHSGTTRRSIDLAGTYAAPGTFCILQSGTINPGSSLVRVNGVQDVTNTFSTGTGIYGEYPMFFFARNNATLFSAMREYSSVGINRLLTDTERDNLEAWTQARFTAAVSEPAPTNITFTPTSVDETAEPGTSVGSFT